MCPFCTLPALINTVRHPRPWPPNLTKTSRQWQNVHIGWDTPQAPERVRGPASLLVLSLFLLLLAQNVPVLHLSAPSYTPPHPAVTPRPCAFRTTFPTKSV